MLILFQLQIAQNSETADNYLIDMFSAPPNIPNYLMIERAFRLSAHLAKSYPSRTALFIRQSIECIQAMGEARAALILQVCPFFITSGKKI